MKAVKTKSGNYRVQKMVRGQKLSLTFDHRPTKREIEEEVSKRLGFYNGKMTFEEGAKTYIESRSNVLSPSTIREYKGTLRRLDEKFKLMGIDDITQSDLQLAVNKLAKNRAPKTVKNYHGFIASVIFEYRPDMIIRTKLPMNTSTEPYIPTREDIKTLIDYARDTQYEVPILLGCCSMRRGEICALDESDIDFENNIIHVTKDMVQDENKNWVVKPPKTVKSIRDIVVPDEVIDAIKRNGLYKGHPNSITDWMEKAEKKLGLKHFSLHKTRHYFVSEAHNNGVSDANIMATGGWATPNVMIKHYRHANNESAKVTSTVLDGIF